jgi:uncharacterized membrane-anchored protein YitT (DUF2179 family)
MSLSSPQPNPLAPPPVPHTLWEDAQGLLVGTLFVALGVLMFREVGLFTGGVTGLAFWVHYLLGYPLGWAMVVMNAPFFVFGWFKLGAAFTVKTTVAVALLAVYVELLPLWLSFDVLHPTFAAVMAGLLVGVGILMLIRHRASLGGVTIVALFLQNTRGWQAGHVQMAIDACILAAVFVVVDVRTGLLSLLGALALNVVIAVNHKAGRYYGA